MARPSKLQFYVASHLRDRVHDRATKAGVSVSELLRSVLLSSLDDVEVGASHATDPGRMARQLTFVVVGIDALLAGHPDHGLRERAHQAFARKCRQLGFPLSTEEGV